MYINGLDFNQCITSTRRQIYMTSLISGRKFNKLSNLNLCFFAKYILNKNYNNYISTIRFEKILILKIVIFCLLLKKEIILTDCARNFKI